MSVVTIAKISGDLEKARAMFEEHKAELEEFAARGRAAGALHHRFGAGEDFVLVIDEWDSADHFREFFFQPNLQEFIRAMGGTGEPEITIVESLNTSDQF